MKPKTYQLPEKTILKLEKHAKKVKLPLQKVVNLALEQYLK